MFLPNFGALFYNPKYIYSLRQSFAFFCQQFIKVDDLMIQKFHQSIDHPSVLGHEDDAIHQPGGQLVGFTSVLHIRLPHVISKTSEKDRDQAVPRQFQMYYQAFHAS